MFFKGGVPLRCSFEYYITAFFIENIRWLILRFTSTFENYPLVADSPLYQYLWELSFGSWFSALPVPLRIILWWLILRFTSTFENYPLLADSAFWQHFRNSYWDDLSVILFTLTHPSKRLKTCLRLITEKVDQGVKSV